MLSYFEILTATCDGAKKRKSCWKDTAIQLEASESKEDAITALEKLGWEIIAQNYVVCPFCSKGIKQNKKIVL